jgi:hypothetical protein
MDDVSAYDVAAANFKLALDFGKVRKSIYFKGNF